MAPSLEQRNTAQQGRYVFHIQNELKKRFQGKYFTYHAGVIALGMLLTFGIGLWMGGATAKREPLGAVFFTAWILFCGLPLGLIVWLSYVPACRAAARAGRTWLKLVPGGAALTGFAAVIAFLLKQLAHETLPAFAITVIAFLAINLGWAPFLRRTTREGRTVLDEIAGFRLFLQKVEEDRLDRLNPPEQVLQAREEFLAYAIALELRESWGDHLVQTFFAAPPAI
jgi:hypothetical protein